MEGKDKWLCMFVCLCVRMCAYVCVGGWVSMQFFFLQLLDVMYVRMDVGARVFPPISLAVSASFPESQYLFVSPQ